MADVFPGGMLYSGVNSACDLWRMERPLTSLESCDFITTAEPQCSTGNVSVRVCEWSRAHLVDTVWSCSLLTGVLVLFQYQLCIITYSSDYLVILRVGKFVQQPQMHTLLRVMHACLFECFSCFAWDCTVCALVCPSWNVYLCVCRGGDVVFCYIV